jgi:SAM-dependent methyltransferase
MANSSTLYDLYERSVQSAQTHIDWVVSIFHDIRGKYPVHLREDFCGTFQLSCAWVKRNRNNTAIGLDLDPEPLTYGKRKHYSKLKSDQKRRLRVLQQNAISTTRPGADVLLVGNFSFYALKEREQLRQYFKNAKRSLTKDGIFILEMAGGPGMIAKMTERRTVKISPKKKFTYVWDQKTFDPITHDATYSIHFHFPNGKKFRDAFTYDWRVWTIPEIREILLEAGFSKTVVYWEGSHKGEGTGEFLPMENGDNAYSWIGYVIGLP